MRILPNGEAFLLSGGCGGRNEKWFKKRGPQNDVAAASRQRVFLCRCAAVERTGQRSGVCGQRTGTYRCMARLWPLLGEVGALPYRLSVAQKNALYLGKVQSTVSKYRLTVVYRLSALNAPMRQTTWLCGITFYKYQPDKKGNSHTSHRLW